MGMNIAEKILARAAGKPQRRARRDRDRRSGDRGPHRHEFPARAAGAQILKMHDPRKVVVVLDHLVPANEPLSAAAHTTARRVRQALRHRALPRCRPRPGHQPCRRRRQRLCAARHGDGQSGFAHLRRRRVQLRGARRRPAGNASSRSPPARAGSGSARPSATSSQGKLAARRLGQGRVPPHRRQIWRARQPERRVWRPRHRRALRLNARRTLAIMGTELSAEFVIFEPDEAMLAYVRARNPAPFTPAAARSPTPSTRSGAASRSTRSSRWWRCPTRW